LRSAHHRREKNPTSANIRGLARRGRRVRLAACLGCGTLALGLLGGCNAILDSKSFIDPGELGRYKQTPLLLKIVDHVDERIEEPDTEFVNAVEVTPEELTNNVSDYVISKNDLLTIEISDLTGPGTQTVKTTRVTESGNLSLPYLSSPIHAEGLTETQLEQTIVDRYRTENIIQKAQVSVIVTEARGRAFSILGQVARPGQYAIVDPEFRVLDALVLAGDTVSPLLQDLYVIRKVTPTTPTAPGSTAPGTAAPPPSAAPTSGPADLAPRGSAAPLAPLSAEASVASMAMSPRDRHVIHLVALPDPGASDTAPATSPSTVDPLAPGAVSPAPVTPPPPTAPGANANGGFEGFHELIAPSDTKIIHVPLDRLKNGDLQFNIIIKPHDQIIVQGLQVGVYYMGGHVQNPGAYSLTGQRVTLKEAIISAHMLDQLAIPQRTDIIRRLGPGKEVFVRVDLDKIFAGHESDIYLKPNDSVMVGTNLIAPFLSALRGAFRITYGFGFLYDRNFAVPNNNGGGTQ
jgi:protein involved in polysaccharide export with SLBB domain